MAQFTCFECNSEVRTGEKFTFTKKGSVHFDCFVSSKRKGLESSKVEQLRTLSLILDSELTHLLNLLKINPEHEGAKEYEKQKYKDIEKAAGDTTRKIDEL
jgi:Uncharacterized protein conserved in archaea